MDKRKEKTLQEIRKEIGLQMQDRRSFLNALLNIENFEQSIELKNSHIIDMKAQISSGTITEKNRFDHNLTKEELERDIISSEFQLRQMKLNLDFLKEDFYYLLNTKVGLIDKAGSLEALKERIKAHFTLMREEYEKAKDPKNDSSLLGSR